MEGVITKETTKKEAKKKKSLLGFKRSLKKKEQAIEKKTIKSDDLFLVELPRERNKYGNLKYLVPFQYEQNHLKEIDEGNPDIFSRSTLVKAGGALHGFMEDERGVVTISLNKPKLTAYQKTILKEIEDLKKVKK